MILGGRLVVRHAAARGGRGVGCFVSRRAWRRVSSAITFAGRGCGACRAVTSVRCRCMSAPLCSLYVASSQRRSRRRSKRRCGARPTEPCPRASGRGDSPRAVDRGLSPGARMNSGGAHGGCPHAGPRRDMSRDRRRTCLQRETLGLRAASVLVKIGRRGKLRRRGRARARRVSPPRVVRLVVHATRLPFGPGSIRSSYVEGFWSPALSWRTKKSKLKQKRYFSSHFRAETRRGLSLSGGASVTSVLSHAEHLPFLYRVTSPETTKATRWVALAWSRYAASFLARAPLCEGRGETGPAHVGDEHGPARDRGGRGRVGEIRCVDDGQRGPHSPLVGWRIDETPEVRKAVPTRPSELPI
jgi:hypothetical protein